MTLTNKPIPSGWVVRINNNTWGAVASALEAEATAREYMTAYSRVAILFNGHVWAVQTQIRRWFETQQRTLAARGGR